MATKDISDAEVLRAYVDAAALRQEYRGRDPLTMPGCPVRSISTSSGQMSEGRALLDAKG